MKQMDKRVVEIEVGGQMADAPTDRYATTTYYVDEWLWRKPEVVLATMERPHGKGMQCTKVSVQMEDLPALIAFLAATYAEHVEASALART